jgi:hypothetical protein
MKDSRIARRDDDNHDVFMRRYRRANKVASPISAWGCESWSRSITLPPPRPRSVWTPLRSTPPPPPPSPVLCRQRCPPPPPPAASYSPPEKMRYKEVSISYYKNDMKIKRLPRLSESGSINPPIMGPCASSSLLGVYRQYYNPEKGCPSATPYYSFLQRASSWHSSAFLTSCSKQAQVSIHQKHNMKYKEHNIKYI